MQNIKIKIDLALQGGGAHGAFTWGILDRLLERDIFSIEGISATSAGSMNAIVLAQGMMEDGPEQARKLLTEFWKMVSNVVESMGISQRWPIDYFLQPAMKEPLSFFMFSEFTNLFSPYQFNPLNYHPLKDILDKMIDIEQLKKNCKIKLFICATNVRTGKIHIFDNNELSIEAILASACFPKLFQAVKVNNEYYWDGGYLGNPAIFPLIYNTSTQDILILHTVPIARHEIPTSIIEIDTRLREISFNSSLAREMRAIAFVSRMLQNDWLKPEYTDKLKLCYMHCMRADEIMREFSYASVMYPDWDLLLSLKEAGRRKADEWLDENLQHIGKKSTVNFEEWV